jgi:hypothetical protein
MLGFFHAHRLLGDPRAAERTRRSFEAIVAAARVPGAPTAAEPSAALPAAAV